MEQDAVFTVIVGRVGRRFTNALTMTFVDAAEGPDGPPGAPPPAPGVLAPGVLAAARQGGAGGFGGRFAIALGLRNHGPGRHLTQTREGDRIVTASGYDKASVIERNGSAVATVACGATTTVTDPWGGVLLTVEPDSDRPSSPDVDRMVVRDERGQVLARIHVILAASGWQLSPNDVIGFGLALASEGLGALLGDGTPANGSLPIRILGTRLLLHRPVTVERRDLLLGLCVDLAIGGRTYIAAA